MIEENKVVTTERDVTLDVLKMAFAVLIVFHHMACDNLIPGFEKSFLGVEFFFLVSGYMLINSMNKNSDETLIQFLKHKVLIFFPYLIVAEIISVVWIFSVNCFVNNIDIIPALYDALLSLTNIFMINSEMPFLASVEWYISSMMIATVILYPIIKKFGKNFTMVFSPMIALLIIGYIYAILPTISNPHYWIYFLKEGVLRGLAIMMLGIFAYECSLMLSKINLNRSGTVIFTLITALSFIYVFVNICMYAKIESGLTESAFEFLIIMFMFIGLVGLMSNQTPLNIYADNKTKKHISVLLGTGSLLIYLNHASFVGVIKEVFPQYTNDQLILICFILIITASIFCYYLTKCLRKRAYKLFID